MPDFKYNKSVLNKDDMDIILAGIQGLSSIDDSAKIKTLLAKLRFSNSNKIFFSMFMSYLFMTKLKMITGFLRH